ncbi:TPA: hypothetical protein ACX6S8_002645 [Photobacterium damselae]
MKAIEINIFDFTKGNWKDDGNYLSVNGEGVSYGYFSEHVEGETVVKPELAVYIPDEYLGDHLVSTEILDGWLSDMDSCNDYHWYECILDFIKQCTNEWMIEQLGGRFVATVDISIEQLGYIDYQNDSDIQAELDEIRSSSHDFSYDTVTVKEAHDRVNKDTRIKSV